jgi:PAS domain S-box-containing protein
MYRESSKLSTWFLSRPKRTGFIFFLSLLTLISLIVLQRYLLFKENKSREITNILTGVEQNIHQSLKNSYNVALMLALTVNDEGVPMNFDVIAEKLVKSNSEFQAVQLVPNGVIKYLHSLKGNEGVLNVDLFKSPAITQIEMKRAIDSREMYFQGPVKLNQGGIGVVGRMPMFIKGKFWGFSVVVIKLDTLFKNAGIDNEKYKDYKFQFSKVNAITKKEEFFIPLNIHYLKKQSKSIIFTEGDWKLSLINVNPYDTWFNLISAILFGLGLAILSTYLLIKLLKKQAQLRVQLRNKDSQLVDTESKFKNIFDNAAIGIARINSKTGQILEVNQYLCNFLGFNAAELMEKKIKSVIYQDDLEEDRVLFKKMLAGEIRQFSTETRYVNKNGSVNWGNVIITPLWNEGKEPSNHILILEDVMQRKIEEKTLIESQKRIESLINTIDGIVWEANLQTHESIFISKKVEDILGYSVEEWMSSPDFWLQKLYPEDRERMVIYVSKLLPGNNQHVEEYRLYAKDGSLVWIRDIVTVIDEPNQPVKLRGIMIDVTSHKEAEAALDKSYTLVSEQNKRLLNFSYIVSHNLRSHASNILGISTLIENAQNEEDRNEMIQLLKTVSTNLNETLLNLNNIVSIQTSLDVVVEPLNLSEYVLRTLETQNVQILSKEAIVINEIDEDIEVNFNKAYLESILLNLISNALRYSHPDRVPIINLTCVEENHQWVLKVADNGVGIDLNKHGDKMFGIYQTFNGNADARGFGLFISKNQIDAMGGKIEVESTLGEGTTFKIYFKG